ncbi:hypothetical protein [Ethanoligenens sp.]|uniref:hypothetical protein n=1 Tax=Ethanoligenens sp. TaxID=2099655 RepID=UPI0039E951C8
MNPADFTYEQLSMIAFALDLLREDSRGVAADRYTTIENRGKARQQVKTASTIIRQLGKEMSKYPGREPAAFVTYTL